MEYLKKIERGTPLSKATEDIKGEAESRIIQLVNDLKEARKDQDELKTQSVLKEMKELSKVPGITSFYRLFETLSGKVEDYEDGFTLVELYPKTGRTHQLRVVLAHFNHPIVGDGHYLGGKRGSADARWCPRQFLHAKRLCLTMPASGERRCFESALPSDLQTAWQAIKAAV